MPHLIVLRSASAYCRAIGPLVAVGLALAPTALAAPLPLSAPSTESFDALVASGTGNPWLDDATIEGWYATRTTYNAGTGSSNAGALYSFGAAGTGERGLGSVASGSTGSVLFGAQFVNDTPDTISALTVQYAGEQWRNGGSASATPSLPQRLAFSYQVAAPDLSGGSWIDVAALDFVSPVFGGTTASALDGNAAPNRVTLSATIDGLSVAPGQTVWLRFADINDPNNDHGLAIDDLSVSVAGSVPGGGGGPEEPEPTCAALDTPIGAVQGSGASAAIVGEVTVQGVVVGDFEGPSPALRGFYLQDSGDGDPSSSDAIFVFNGNNDDVQLGDEVQVTAVAGEFQGQTQLSGLTSMVVCESGQTVAPTQVVLPVPSVDFLERYEGMLVRFEQPLYVTELFQLGRFGQVTVSADDRLYQPTSVLAPGADANALQAFNDRSRILVDDALQSQNPDPIVFGRGGLPLSASNTLRGGDSVTGLTGVLTYTWAGNAASGNAYRMRPVGALGGGAPNFVAAHARPSAPSASSGTLRVASFNVLNFFNTFGSTACSFGVGGAAAECRGAENTLELERQASKIVAAILALEADVIGVIEIENDGYGPDSAMQDLVNRLNAAAGTGAFALLDVDTRVGTLNAAGTDAIKQGFLYRTAAVTPVAGMTFVDVAPVHNRAPIAQTFEDVAGERVTVVVNHFKSKGCGGAAGADLDQADGQGCYNAARVAQATALTTFLADIALSTGEPDVLVVGDLNAYAQEDPIVVLEAAGYANLLAELAGPLAYTYVFDGQWGYLDYALASGSLRAQVTGAAGFAINADEPSVLDYNTNFKSAAQLASLYAPDAYRASDHDPVLVDLSLDAPTSTYPFTGFFGKLGQPSTAVKAGSAVPVVFSLGGERGLTVLTEGSPSYRRVDCLTLSPLGEASPITTPGSSALSYDACSDRYTIVWKTPATLRNTCQELGVSLDDGSVHTVMVRFK